MDSHNSQVLTHFSGTVSSQLSCYRSTFRSGSGDMKINTQFMYMDDSTRFKSSSTKMIAAQHQDPDLAAPELEAPCQDPVLKVPGQQKHRTGKEVNGDQ